MENERIHVQEVPLPVIEVKNVTKAYKLYGRARDRVKEAFGFGGKQAYQLHYALNGVNLCVHRGEAVGIIGTNGSGKSTILKIITGVLSPTSGEVAVHGRISALLELGAGFNMDYNGIENVYLNGTMMGFTDREIEERLPEILDFADIGAYVNQPVRTYSSGMFVRLAFAVAINIDPEILIVDEALSVGDVFFQAKCYRKFEEFKNQGRTIVFVSHDLGIISKYCDRVFLLNQGTLLGEGSPKEMIDAYKRVLVGQYEIQEEQERLSEGVVQEGQEEQEEQREQEGQEEQEGQKEQEGQGQQEGQGEQEQQKEQEEQKEQEPQGRKSSAGVNPNALEYGTGQAEILEYYLTDDQGIRTVAVLKGSMFAIHLRVRFRDHIPAPIFAFTFKNVLGTEITGTNSMLEKAFLESAEAGQVKDVTFTQRMSLQGGEYLLSFGVTGYNGEVFEVYHRLYDALNVTVVSDKNTVGYYDMESAVEVSDAPGRTRETGPGYKKWKKENISAE